VPVSKAFRNTHSYFSDRHSRKPDDVPLHEETDSPTDADDHNFYKVEKWTRDGTKADSQLYAGDSLGRARAVFERSIKHRPRIRLMIRWRTRLLDQWPPAHARQSPLDRQTAGAVASARPEGRP
jgi:hypothetical protein